jgi:DNA-binding CsgD family transcriptional regulator
MTQPRISKKEMRVWREIATGKPTKLIAYTLDITEFTVKVHIRNLMKKLKLTNRTELALAYYPIDFKNPPDHPHFESPVKREVEHADIQPSL